MPLACVGYAVVNKSTGRVLQLCATKHWAHQVGARLMDEGNFPVQIIRIWNVDLANSECDVIATFDYGVADVDTKYKLLEGRKHG